jgi:PAS domain S-box-containing protein
VNKKVPGKSCEIKKSPGKNIPNGSERREAANPIATVEIPEAESQPLSLPALRLSEIRYRRLFETARDGVLLVDPDTRKITDANPFMIEILGYTLAEFVGKELWEIGLLGEQKASREMFRELREKHFIRYEDLPLKSVNGQTREVEVIANLYQEGAHQVIQCNIRDITSRKQVERELVAAKEKIELHARELEETVKQRTAQLRETIGELESFSYSISHDMRAPLRTMRGFAEILLLNHAAQLDADGIAYLKRISTAAARMDRLIEEVLVYTSVLRADVKIMAVDLDALVRLMIDTYPHLEDKPDIRIEGVLPKVMGGELSLSQCISNLLANALKFVAPGTKPQVRIRAERLGEDVRLWVEDNGIGISAEDQHRIFNMFERVDCDAAYEGTGMGLTIVNKAIERMGGQRGVESKAGQGSKFWIQLKGAAA